MATRTRSAYWLWLADHRTQLTKEHGLEGKRGSEVSKKAGEVWKTLPESEKMHYQDLAAKDKARYVEEVKTLGKKERMPRAGRRGSTGKGRDAEDSADKDNVTGGRPSKMVKREKDPQAPKKPMTGYFMWVNDTRSKITQDYKLEGQRGSEVTKVQARLWKEVDEQTKEAYHQKFTAAKMQYTKDLAAYRAGG